MTVREWTLHVFGTNPTVVFYRKGNVSHKGFCNGELWRNEHGHVAVKVEAVGYVSLHYVMSFV